MIAVATKFLDFLKLAPQFVIPIYQRTYSWTEKECIQLWNDIIRTGTNDQIAVHFVGSIVYIAEGDANIAVWRPFLVIDGQQRLTTVMLLIKAVANALGEAEPIDGFSTEKLHGYYLKNQMEKGEKKFKLLLSQTDRATLNAIIDSQEQPTEYSLRVAQNFRFFEEKIADCTGDLTAVCKGLAKLIMVDIKLKRGEDNPQLIFESMNSTGKELSQADLIRNYILMGLDPDLQTRLYEQYWRPMEIDFGQEAYGTHFDGFMRHYLTVVTREIPNIKAVYEAFKEHAQASKANFTNDAEHIERLVQEIRMYARHFCAMALGKETDAKLKVAFQDLRELKVDVAYPFLLELYRDYKAGVFSAVDLLKSIRLVEAYVFRRAICSIPTNSMNKTFATFNKALNKAKYFESIQAHFLSLPSYRRFPSDEEFHRDIQIRDLYNFRSRSYWLRRLENHRRLELVSVGEYTIEHIMPQNENLSAKWRQDLGENWQHVQITWLHTLGNLTLTAYNSDYSDRTFIEKRDLVGEHNEPKGFKFSPLKLNDGLGVLEKWDEHEIKARAKRLADIACKVWYAPDLSREILDTYRQKQEIPVSYTIESHPYLLAPTMRLLFEAFSEAVLALDPCVSVEFLKLYVAFKAETNFVDVVPQSSRLRLSLNMRFADINDPKGICKDVTNIGRWGNGDVEIHLSKLEELPYVLGLVRQSLELQLGNDDNV